MQLASLEPRVSMVTLDLKVTLDLLDLPDLVVLPVLRYCPES